MGLGNKVFHVLFVFAFYVAPAFAVENGGEEIRFFDNVPYAKTPSGWQRVPRAEVVEDEPSTSVNTSQPTIERKPAVTSMVSVKAPALDASKQKTTSLPVTYKQAKAAEPSKSSALIGELSQNITTVSYDVELESASDADDDSYMATSGVGALLAVGLYKIWKKIDDLKNNPAAKQKAEIQQQIDSLTGYFEKTKAHLAKLGIQFKIIANKVMVQVAKADGVLATLNQSEFTGSQSELERRKSKINELNRLLQVEALELQKRNLELDMLSREVAAESLKRKKQVFDDLEALWRIQRDRYRQALASTANIPENDRQRALAAEEQAVQATEVKHALDERKAQLDSYSASLLASLSADGIPELDQSHPFAANYSDDTAELRNAILQLNTLKNDKKLLEIKLKGLRLTDNLVPTYTVQGKIKAIEATLNGEKGLNSQIASKEKEINLLKKKTLQAVTKTQRTLVRETKAAIKAATAHSQETEKRFTTAHTKVFDQVEDHKAVQAQALANAKKDMDLTRETINFMGDLEVPLLPRPGTNPQYVDLNQAVDDLEKAHGAATASALESEAQIFTQLHDQLNHQNSLSAEAKAKEMNTPKRRMIMAQIRKAAQELLQKEHGGTFQSAAFASNEAFLKMLATTNESSGLTSSEVQKVRQMIMDTATQLEVELFEGAKAKEHTGIPLLNRLSAERRGAYYDVLNSLSKDARGGASSADLLTRVSEKRELASRALVEPKSSAVEPVIARARASVVQARNGALSARRFVFTTCREMLSSPQTALGAAY